ncbi:hypothetical protein [Synechococcus sp. CS-1328]|uniref:hypothetical protein n=1 Tax=Synechococcus sp. CS-1328 TaxID=2847976 RepID=UPI00223BC830|nr:hypothetical protein [Synechococcus sp. CS-1328]MCT0226512.1 hypothetical protein [Synechococcus sp. CS-1328]
MPEGTNAAEGQSSDPVQSYLLAWTLVPEEEVITPDMVATSERPDPPRLPEILPPAVPEVRNLANGITVNGAPYPDTALYVHNGFAADPEFTVTTTLLGISRTRDCFPEASGDPLKCADLEADIFLTPFRSESASLGLQWTTQSLSGRDGGTPQFAAQSLGFRTAVNLTPTTGLAFGGEHIIQFDNNTDQGRNFYLVLSQAIPFRGGPDPFLAVATVGIGSDFFGYKGNGVIGSTNCLSGNNISSPNYPEGNDCRWGPIGSLNLFFGPHLSIGAEWFGYGIGAGISVLPLRDIPFTLTIYATDFLGNTPDYLEGLCTTNPCQTRYLVRASMSF